MWKIKFEAEIFWTFCWTQIEANSYWWSASKFCPNFKKTTNKTRFLGEGTKENCWTKKTTRIFGMKHCFARPKLQILRTKSFSFFCVWKPVLLQCLFLNRATKLSICSHQSLNKKKIRDNGCCLLKNFTRPNQLYKVFLPVSPFQKKTDVLKKEKSQ